MSAMTVPPTLLPGSPSFQPLYDQIKILLTRSLIAGEWKPGDAIPSEMELAVRYQVSQGTVRKAIDALAAENILIRRQGKAVRRGAGRGVGEQLGNERFHRLARVGVQHRDGIAVGVGHVEHSLISAEFQI